MSYHSNMKTPNIIQKEICSECGGKEKIFRHLPRKSPADSHHHVYQPRLETRIEAAYRQGYEDGFKEASSKALWGEGWD